MRSALVSHRINRYSLTSHSPSDKPAIYSPVNMQLGSLHEIRDQIELRR
jgi:hypothetical protein